MQCQNCNINNFKAIQYSLRKKHNSADHIGNVDGEHHSPLWPLHKNCHEAANEPGQEGGRQEIEVTQNVPEGGNMMVNGLLHEEQKFGHT